METLKFLARTIEEERARKVAQAAEAARGAGEVNKEAKMFATSSTSVPSFGQGAHPDTFQLPLSHPTFTQLRPPQIDIVDKQNWHVQ